ncbi:murein hydrolase activator EnvC [Fibrobacter sp. UWB11]|uniref:murein hydrolase activator EnvC family protein n=1 Tax=Fibrobacter sp. UWB11 TaxID=1896202 RepID=UPI00092AF961|nr:peptidoglycan DD-metalloendopeptidase family protein [Fibrobacter sp. UWB11]SIO37578.1 Septal ring factor EnvC, activator of murein hydrolases AmiA and AmiB [Fibrobacter sp. UWB11]
MRRISRLFLLVFLAFAVMAFEPATVWGAPLKRTDTQIDEQKNALRKLEVDLAKKREELAVLETEEKGVLNTISLLDQNLNRTRSYLSELTRNEDMLQGAVKQLVMDIDSLDMKIRARKRAMRKRIRNLYVYGRSNDAEILFNLLTKNGNPEREVYWVHHLLNRDREDVETLRKLVAERTQKQQAQEKHLAELSRLRSRKAVEERGLVAQMNGQARMLNSLKHDKAVQRMALKEFERNQKTMLALLKKLEQRRKREIEEAKRAEAARLAALKKKEKAAEKKREADKKREEEKARQAEAAKKTIQVSPFKGPKCMPLDGPIISEYGLQEHPVLHIMTRNLGVEIRGKRGGRIRAAAAGTVAMVAEIDGRGPSVIIEHEDGTYTVYGHMKAIHVQEGKSVKKCEEIGEVGDIASLNGIKLYFQVSEGTQTVDPLQWLKQK